MGHLREVLSLREQDSRVKIITFTRNFGQMAAMLAGFKEATGDAVINISADLQDPVELIPQMVEKWSEGAEIVICYRTDRADTLLAKFFSRLAYGVLRMSLPQIPPGGFDFVLMDRKVMNVFNAIDVRHRFFQGDLLWTGYRTCFIPYARLKRTIGKSQYNFAKKLKNFLDAVLDASYLPIRFISLVGLITSTLGVLYSATIVYSWLRGETPFAGWAPIMIAILLVGGLIMVMLGGDRGICLAYQRGSAEETELCSQGQVPMSDNLSYTIVEGIKCFSPEVANSYADYPDRGFDLTEKNGESSFWVRSRNRLFKSIVQDHMVAIGQNEILGNRLWDRRVHPTNCRE